MAAKVWIDGKYWDKLDAKVSAFDHGVLFGDGVTAGTRLYDGRPFRLDHYLDLLYLAADGIGLTIPYSQSELARTVETVVRNNQRREGFVRILVTRGAGTLTLDPRKCEPNVVVITESVVLYPRELYDAGLDVIAVATSPTIRMTLSQGPLARAKHLALRAGCLDALLHDANGAVSGATDAALFLIEGNSAIVPPIEACPDPVTARFVVELFAELGIPVVERPVQRDELFAATELVLAGQAGEVIALRSVDGKPIGTGGEGPIARRLRDRYREAVRRSAPSDRDTHGERGTSVP